MLSVWHSCGQSEYNIPESHMVPQTLSGVAPKPKTKQTENRQMVSIWMKIEFSFYLNEKMKSFSIEKNHQKEKINSTFILHWLVFLYVLPWLLLLIFRLLLYYRTWMFRIGIVVSRKIEWGTNNICLGEGKLALKPEPTRSHEELWHKRLISGAQKTVE